MGTYAPRSYQEACLESIGAARNSGANKALVVMASGLGKTLTSIFDVQRYLKDFPNGRILVLCHSAAILGQTKEVYKSNFGDEYSYGMYNAYEKPLHRTDFLFANLQSVKRHKEDFQPDEFDIIIVDEAHHSPAETYKAAIDYFRPKFLLGMTATPDRMDDANISSIFGKPVFEYELTTAIRDGWLSKVEYRIKTDEIQSIEGYIDSVEKISLAQLNRSIFIPKRDEEIVRIIRQETSEIEDPTMVIFCQTIEHAERIAKLTDAVVIHSGLDPATVSDRLEGYRLGKIKTVCAVDMLNEGIDVPRTDVVVFLRVTQSKIVFMQQLGRGLRLAEGKDKVLVLDFVSTADRLEMLFQFEREFKSSVGRFTRKRDNTGRTFFILNTDTPVFNERKVDIVNLIERARGGIYFTDEDLIVDFRKECEDLGHFPSQEEFHYHPSAQYRKRFGSLRRLAKLSGCMDYWDNYVHQSRCFPEGEALDLLAELYHELGRKPTAKELDSASGLPTGQYYRSHFGGIIKSLKLRGIDVDSDNWSREKIVVALKNLYSELGRPIQADDLDGNRDGIPSKSSIAKYFGSLSAAMLHANLPIKSFKVSKDPNTIAIYREHGLPVELRELCEFIIAHHNDPDSPARLFNRRSAMRHLQELNRKYDPAVHATCPTRDEVIKALQRKADELGKTPTRRDVKSDSTMPSDYYIKKIFGSYNAGIIAAGLQVNSKYGR